MSFPENCSTGFRMTSERTRLLLRFSADWTGHPFPSFISPFPFLKLKCLWTMRVFRTHSSVPMPERRWRGWSADAEVHKAGFVPRQHAPPRPIPLPSPILQPPLLSGSGQEMNRILRKKSTLKSTRKRSHDHVTGLKLRWLPRWLENC